MSAVKNRRMLVALCQRRKGRDLFDLWIGLNLPEVDADQITAALGHYMRDRVYSDLSWSAISSRSARAARPGEPRACASRSQRPATHRSQGSSA